MACSGQEFFHLGPGAAWIVRIPALATSWAGVFLLYCAIWRKLARANRWRHYEHGTTG